MRKTAMENLNLIRKTAWSFHKTTGLDFEDLFQEACYAYFKALRSHDESKGMKSTLVVTAMQNHLKNYIRDEKKMNGHIEVTETFQENSFDVNYLFESFTEDGMKAIKEILKFSTPFLKNKAVAYNELKYRLALKGWTDLEIKTTISEIENAFC